MKKDSEILGHGNIIRKIQGVERGFAILKSKQKGFKVLVTLITIIFMSMQAMPFNMTYAKNAATSGKYFGVHWTYDKANKTLTITGKGKMHDYSGDTVFADGDDCPWWDFSNETEKIVIGEGITHIGGSAFNHFVITSVSIPESVTSIGYSAFSDCGKLKSIKLPDKLKKIDLAALSRTYLKDINIPDDVRSMGEWMFSECDNLHCVTLPKNLKTLPEGTFRNCPKLKSVTIPANVTIIGPNAFENSGIRSIVIPKNVTTLKNDIFIDCKYLTTITIKSEKLVKLSKHTWKGLSKDTVIRVPKKKLNAYKDMFYKAGLNKKIVITQG